MRTVIYARYSSQLQNGRSIDGQLNDCRERCAREGWTIVGEFCDAAISGAKGIDEAARPGLSRMLAQVEAGGIQQVLADSTSRIARDEADAIQIRRRIQFAGARLFTLADGEVDDIKGWVKGFLDAQQRRDLAHNIRRGQRTSVAQGRAPAGLAYGYRQANVLSERGELVRGLRAIDEAQAEIVRRIFAEYADGSSPRAIAERLNDEGVLGPRQGPWNVTTIRGDRKRLNGMLVNRLYIGELIVNRTSKVANPQTRRTIIRPNDTEDWMVQQAQHLRIIAQPVWDAVQERIASMKYVPFNKTRRPKHLLSALGVCGLCGGGFVKISGEKWGCAGHRNGKGCTNNRQIETPRFLAEVVRGLRCDLLHPDLVAAYEAEYLAERRDKLSTAKRDRQKLERTVSEAGRKIERLAAAIADGGDMPELLAMLSKLRKERDDAAQALKQVDAQKVIAFMPGLADRYRQEIDALESSLDTMNADNDAGRRFRALIHRIVLLPSPSSRGVVVRVEGRMDQVLGIASGSPVAPLYADG